MIRIALSVSARESTLVEWSRADFGQWMGSARMWPRLVRCWDLVATDLKLDLCASQRQKVAALADCAGTFGAVTSLFISEVFRWQRERAREDELAKIRYGALVMQHRFGSSLNLNTHLHAVFPDGVFSRLPTSKVELYELRQPAPHDLEEIGFNVHQRFMRWLRRHGLLRNEIDDEFSNEPPELSALEACAQGSLGQGNLVKKRGRPRASNQGTNEGGFQQRAVNGRVGASHDYSLYAGNTIDSDDKDTRERLLRYCLVPTVASTILAAPTRESKQAPESCNQEVGPRHGAPWRIDWATLLKRVHDVDSLSCPCGGRLKFVELVTEPTTA